MHRIKHMGFNAIKESFDRLPTGVCFFDRTGSIVLCNRQMYRLSQYLLNSDMQYLGEVQEALSAPTGGVVRIPDIDNTYRFPDKTVWRFEKTEVTDRYGVSYIQLTAADVTDLQRALVQLTVDSKKLQADAEKLKQLSDNAGALAREKELLDAKSAMHDGLAACITLTKQYITGEFDGMDAGVVCREWEKVIAFRDTIRQEKAAGQRQGQRRDRADKRPGAHGRRGGAAVHGYAGLPEQRHSVCQGHGDFCKHLGKRGQLYGGDSQ